MKWCVHPGCPTFYTVVLSSSKFMWIQDVIRKFAPAGNRGPHVKFTWCISVLSPSIFVMLMKTTKKSVKLRHCCVQRRCSSTQTSGDGLNGRFGFMPCRSIWRRYASHAARVHIVLFDAKIFEYKYKNRCYIVTVLRDLSILWNSAMINLCSIVTP